MKTKIPFHFQMIAAMGLGCALGAFVGPAIAPVGKLGGVLIQIVKALATPLLFFVLLDSFVHATIHGRALITLLVVCLIDSVFAVFIGMSLSAVFEPGVALRGVLPTFSGATPVLTQHGVWETILGYVPENIFQPFLTHSVPGVILIAVLFGVALNLVKKQGTKIDGAKQNIRFCTDWILAAVSIAVKFTPLAVFAVCAQSVGEKGFSPLVSLGGYVGVAVGGMALQVIFVYQFWIRAVAKMDLKRFWKQARTPVLYSLGVNSSLATLPLTFEALDKLKISPASARIGAGLGTNFNNDGILLYEAMAVLVVAQAYGMDLTTAAKLSLAVSCVVTTFGVAGVPEAGIVALTLVLSSAGLPTEILPLLLTVDWIIARCRSATNVLGDMTVSIALDRFELKGSTKSNARYSRAI